MVWSRYRKGAFRPQSNTHHFFSFLFTQNQNKRPSPQKRESKKQETKPQKKNGRKRKEIIWPQTSQITLASFSPAFHLTHPIRAHIITHHTSHKQRPSPQKRESETNKRSRKKKNGSNKKQMAKYVLHLTGS